MAYELTFNGVTFRIPTTDIMDRIERIGFLDNLRDVCPLGQVWPGPNLLRSGILTPPHYPKLRLNDFFYPTGACRWSIFRGLMTADDVKAATTRDPAKLSFGSGSSNSQGWFGGFKMQSEGGDSAGSVQTDMFMLPPIPVCGGAVKPSVYLITLVDERWYWRTFYSTDTLSYLDSWSDLLTLLSGSLGIALTFTAPDAVYGQPEIDSPLYNASGDSPAVLLDVAAANVGGVIVRNLDGSYKLQRYADALAAIKNQRPGSGDNLLGGIQRWFDMPSLVRVHFPHWIDKDSNGLLLGYDDPTRDSMSNREYYRDCYPATELIDVPANTLPAPYSVYAVGGSNAVLRTTAKARFDSTLTPAWQNETACTDLAKQLAKDLWDSLLARTDEIYAGIYPWQPEGVSDLLYQWRASEVDTRILPPFLTNYGPRDFQHSFGPLAVPDEANVRAEGLDNVIYQGVRTVYFTNCDVTYDPVTHTATITTHGYSGGDQAGNTIVNGLITDVGTDGVNDSFLTNDATPRTVTVFQGRITNIA